MKRFLPAVLLSLALAGCGSSSTTSEPTVETPAAEATTSAPASGCTAGGLDAMTALSEFQLEMDDAQKSGKLTIDQLTAARDKLFNQTQDAQAKDDWASYCKAIDDMRVELNI